MTKEEFVKEYNDLVARAGFQVMPQMTLTVVESVAPKVEETKDATESLDNPL